MHLFDIQCFHTRGYTKPISYVGFRQLEKTVAGPGESTTRLVSGVLRKIFHRIRLYAAIDQFLLIPNMVYATVTGPPFEIGPMKGVSESGRVT